jgi:hypothetical protein
MLGRIVCVELHRIELALFPEERLHAGDCCRLLGCDVKIKPIYWVHDNIVFRARPGIIVHGTIQERKDNSNPLEQSPFERDDVRF